MRIRKMTANFGRLQEQVLELEPGLNVISGQNEAGKTTWAEFLLAMLYGVETRTRAKNGQLPIRTRFAPWDGTPMSGSVELEKDGTRILLERSSENGPLSSFRAKDAETGCDIPGLTAAGCGEFLIGAERAVYQRSGFFRQRQLAVSSDAQLEKRLSSLVTAGSEDYSYAELDARLRKLQSAIRHNQSGELPKAEGALLDTERRLSALEALRTKQNEILAELSACEAREETLRQTLAGIEAYNAMQRRERLRHAKEELQAAWEDREAWQAVCEELPSEGSLSALEVRLQLLQQQAQAAAEEASLDPILTPEPPDDPLFSNLTPKQIEEKAQTDAASAETLQQAVPMGAGRLLCRLIPALLLIAAGAVLLLRLSLPSWLPIKRIPYRDLIGWGLCGLGALIGLLAFLARIRSGRIARQKQFEAEALLAAYHAQSPKDILRQGALAKRRLETYREQKQLAARQTEERNHQALVLMEKQNALIRQAQSLEPSCDSLRKAAALIQDAAQARHALSLAARTQEEAQRLVSALEAQAGEEAEAEAADLGRFADCSKAETLSEHEKCLEQLTRLRSNADRLTGAIAQAGDAIALQAQREELTQQVDRLRARYRALELARTVLEQADREIRSRFAPILCQKASELFSRLTGGKYDRIDLDRDLFISVHPRGSTISRPIFFLSTGAQDLLYFSLRLAICDLVIPEAPIVLDDALVYLDDARAKQALQVLRDLGKTRQILLFTCHTREKRLLDEQ